MPIRALLLAKLSANMSMILTNVRYWLKADIG